MVLLKNVLQETDTLLTLMEADVGNETSLAMLSGKPLMIVKRCVMQIQNVFHLSIVINYAIYLHRVLMILQLKKKMYWKNMDGVFM